ncbi:hypothetical protein INT45_003599 [Circinella minor]|uniref:Angiogenic factor with G patch and FHA domains 1 n=1 Tax=Circinella minor TaxID=1195481 RepID=A0A8H7VE72_9FUNG|nr:hypothetical protein INT45_003599 [Circinella minor]
MSSPDDGFASELDAYLNAQKKKVEADEQPQAATATTTTDQTESSRYLYNQQTDQWYDVVTGEYSRFDTTLQLYVPITPPPIPNNEDDNEMEEDEEKETVFMYLVVVQSKLLTPGQIVTVDSKEGLTVGRDRSWFDRRLRLAELPVSKYHCQIYYDCEDNIFHVIDRGSRNGTFLNKQRLSSIKSSSIPSKLNHLDQLIIGSTLFEVHYHYQQQQEEKDENQLHCCEKCLVNDENRPYKVVDLSDGIRKEDDQQHQGETLGYNMDFKSTEHKEQEWMQELRRLKKSYAGDKKNKDGSKYVDAAERRRRLHASTTTPHYLKKQSQKYIEDEDELQPPPTERNTLQTPVQGIGNTMLQKMGWQHGQTLGKVGNEGIVAPISPMTQTHRAGLGSSSSGNTSQDIITPTSKQQHRYQITKQRYYYEQQQQE